MQPARRSSRLDPFPRPTPQIRHLHLCSPASSVLRTHLTSHQRSCQPYHLWCSLTVPPSLPFREVSVEANRISRFSRLEFPYMHKVFDSAVSVPHSPCTQGTMLPSHNRERVGTRVCAFRSSILGLHVPLLWLHPRCYHRQRTTRGQCDRLGLHCRTLSFPTPNRFIPALSPNCARLVRAYAGPRCIQEP